MYYIPKGKPMHEKLSTSFVRMDGLLEELKAEDFNGYVLLNFASTKGFLFIQDGQIINAAEISGETHRAGVAVQEQLFKLSHQTKGAISVYYLRKEIVQTLAGIADGEAVYKDLTTDWANLGKLIKKLAAEQKTFFINLVFNEAADKRGLIYVEGEKIEAVCSAGDAGLEGDEAYHRLVEDSDHEYATFSVYRKALMPALPKIDEKNVEASLNRFVTQATSSSAANVLTSTPPPPAPTPIAEPAPVPQPVIEPAPQVSSATISAATPAPAPVTAPAPTAAPTQAAPYYESLLPSGTNEPRTAHLNVAEARPKPATFDDILEVVEVEAPAKPAPAPPAPAPTVAAVSASQVTPAPLPEPNKAGNDMRDLMNLMSQVVAAVERGMAVAGRGSSFPTALRAGLLAVTERYPFLDPFAAEFEYQDKEIVFVGTAQPNEFATGLTEALRQMVEDLIYSSNGRVRDYIAEELRKVERDQSGNIRRFNVGNLTEKICQH